MISIIVRTFNEEETIGKTLESIKSQKVRDQIEVVIVDSGSTDQTLEIIKNYQEEMELRIVEISQEEFSYGKALNIGFDNSKGDIIVNLSAHSPAVDEKWLEKITYHIKNSEDTAAVYGKQVPVKDVNPIEAVQLHESYPSCRIIFRGENSIENRTDLSLLSFSNANCAIDEEVWVEKKFDESLPFAEDRKWAEELLNEGKKIVYEPEAAVYHSHELSWDTTVKRSYNQCLAFKEIHNEERTILKFLLESSKLVLLSPKRFIAIDKSRFSSNRRSTLWKSLIHLYGTLVGEIRASFKYNILKK